jgi:hypothetical protein
VQPAPEKDTPGWAAPRCKGGGAVPADTRKQG